jgi:hypothetical protein
VDVDAWIERLTLGDFAVTLLAALAAFAYLALLARAHQRAALLVSLTRKCRRQILRQEELRERLGFAPRLEYYRRLERDLLKRLAREGVRAV